MNKKIDYKKLRDFRVDKDLKQKEVAAKLNITPSAYSRIERGERGLRVEQLKVIAAVLEKNISDFFQEIKKMERNSPQAIKTERELLESILCIIGSNVESELFNLIYKYDSQCPEYPLSFEDYLTDPHANPEMAISQIKDDIEDYKKSGSYPAFYELCGKKGIERLMNQTDEWLRNFVSQEDNYEIVFSAMMSPHYQKWEDSFLAFKNMLSDNPIIHCLFQYGLLETSWFSVYWSKYLEEMKSSPSGDGASVELIQNTDIFEPTETDYVITAERRKDREKIRRKMNDIFSRNKQGN